VRVLFHARTLLNPLFADFIRKISQSAAKVLESSILKGGFTYLLGKILVIRQCIKGVVTYFVAEGNHRVLVMQRHPDRFPTVIAIVIAAPDGM
jgi:hypothetical protein